MTKIAKLLARSTAVAFIGLVAAPHPANAWCAGYHCDWYSPRSYYQAPASYGYAISPYYAQSYFPNLAVYGDTSNLFMVGYAYGYRDSYGCLWLDRQCPKY